MMSADLLANPDRLEDYARKLAKLAKQLHSTDVSDSGFANTKELYIDALAKIEKYMTEEEIDKVRRLIQSIPDRNTFIHGDLHMGNVMLQDGEMVLIDMGEAGIGHPVFEIAEVCLAYYFAPQSPNMSRERLLATVGLEPEMCEPVYRYFMEEYFGCTGEELAGKLKIVMGFCHLRLLLITILMNRDVPEEAWISRVETARKALLPFADELALGIKTLMLG